MSPPLFSIPLIRIESRSPYWGMGVSVVGLVGTAFLLGTLAQWSRHHPIPWIEDHSRSPIVKASAAGIEPVSLEQARRIVSGQTALVLDARPLAEFDLGHLPGAVSFPNANRTDAYYEMAALLQAEQPLLVYCSSKSCDDALELALFLRSQGCKKVFLFTEGFSAWKVSGFPVE